MQKQNRFLRGEIPKNEDTKRTPKQQKTYETQDKTCEIILMPEYNLVFCIKITGKVRSQRFENRNLTFYILSFH